MTIKLRVSGKKGVTVADFSNDQITIINTFARHFVVVARKRWRRASLYLIVKLLLSLIFKCPLEKLWD